MNYTQEITNAFDDVAGRDGASRGDFEHALAEAKKAVAKLQAYKKNNTWPVLNSAERTDDLEGIEATAKHIREHFSTMVVLGMGASSRGGSALVALAENRFASMPGKTKIHFIDNIDPVTFDELRAALDYKKTLFLVISKSGGTVETMAQAFVLMKEVEAKTGKMVVKDHFIFITEPTANPLRQLAEKYGIKTLEHDANIGGRFSALTVVGLLPAAVAGLDIRAVRRGAAEVVRYTFADGSPEPAKGAALFNALIKKGKTISVMMPYADRLDAFGAWHQQLWAESLGKDGKGMTALRALGAFDQHSQLQLYLDGPRDKFITLIFLKNKNSGAAIEAPLENSLAYLGGHKIGDLMESAQLATASTLTKNKCPTRIFSLDKLNEESLGALMMHFMLETMIMAELLGIDAFGQPAVEEGKRLAREYLS
jgi:glucose-6-phosphate isomerase